MLNLRFWIPWHYPRKMRVEEGNNSVEVRAGRATLEPLWVPFRGATSAISGGPKCDRWKSTVTSLSASFRLRPLLSGFTYSRRASLEGKFWTN